jgi:hypothetical protein
MKMRNEIISVRLSRIEKRRLTDAAKKEGCPVSDLIRWSLRHELAAALYDKAAGRLNQAGQ